MIPPKAHHSSITESNGTEMAEIVKDFKIVF
jgi:hypothetical protein